MVDLAYLVGGCYAYINIMLTISVAYGSFPTVWVVTGRQRRKISLLMKIFREKPDPFFLSFISCF
ncbi:hypothetical protein AEV48_04075 [Salmonella enterica subsp. enterica serovar Worthington]|nr:hypothetical protein AEU85_17985 [Salmonella enterica subsp. enterica serovar Worthington]KNM65176.1 hypothetical protein AEU99_13775 [Salmonella enterica subsp. enterica serovar Worthington]KNO63454.1 hypothetical protein AEV48_04075 [Salmonella enterica subsp. enterica serovar Worthington]KNW77981.1 hypothetical protein AEX29_04375 [Salmonella enterica subsp. enterica serovar Worthington]